MNYPDSLMERYFQLAFTQTIPNMARYAFEWKVLAEDAEKAGRSSSAAAWRARGEFYAKQAGVEYIRLIEGSFSELIQVAPPTEAGGFVCSQGYDAGDG